MSVEPNDTIFDANDSGVSSGGTRSVILNGEIDPNEIDPSTDVDFYQFQANAGDQITLDVDANELGLPLDSRLRLFDSDGNEIDNSDDNIAPGESPSSDPYLAFTPESSGDYFVGVSYFQNFAYDPFDGSRTNNVFSGENGSYELEISFANENTEDDSDPDILSVKRSLRD